MKRTIIPLSLSSIAFNLNAQNNYYPTTGNVGLGTTTSSSKLQHPKCMEPQAILKLTNKVVGILWHSSRMGNDSKVYKLVKQ